MLRRLLLAAAVVLAVLAFACFGVLAFPLFQFSIDVWRLLKHLP